MKFAGARVIKWRTNCQNSFITPLRIFRGLLTHLLGPIQLRRPLQRASTHSQSCHLQVERGFFECFNGERVLQIKLSYFSPPTSIRSSVCSKNKSFRIYLQKTFLELFQRTFYRRFCCYFFKGCCNSIYKSLDFAASKVNQV